ncbi:Adenosylmethionine-8-amino-7-oxononanoate aminotransferase (EC 2.6.1.62) [uncultured Gammaproteobacteria bacterium]|uniref:adenosylmethionine--8-amino-7-oxononanoate transaminase n=1 Tax=Bathymodiolus heckerae thiotrophic gill symbiont TaxID=1052212 RepID=UPI0010BB1FE6|nr:adenosylmethionine--8-amino-7-oxononanoate transaminase [Bathymodiolus heckerae thiotrophic gill symbiont]CAC9591118.1 Adenosylmethionine-8-amino-7-oxononanoate aminotransferase (EC 2.6.1.62) [uncultured Gammaproteobacteria bacterium]SHN91274.1 Adenosylmethionine-8-amino-7-oxononanoate aminotransferase [Bathymodiolus heckerae thiotrophic gill symbiont]
MDTFDQQHIWHPYAKVPNLNSAYKVLSADGVYLNLEGDKRVIDGMSSWWAAIHGYNHPVLNQAVIDQLGKMSHVMFGGLTHDLAIELAKILVDLTPDNLTKVFFTDSGSVAVESALKMALQYWHNKGQTDKHKFVTIRGGYHGDTFGAMSVCDPDNGMHHLFSNVLSKHYFVKSPSMVAMDEALLDLEETLEQYSNNIAAMILEPVVQGAGGMRLYNPQYLTKAKALCEKYQILFILDEIATGFGRTGELFALEYVDVEPDILCLGKALTGGYMTLAATLTTDEISKGVGTLMHGPTFMANPLACSVAIASIYLLLNSPWQDDIASIEAVLNSELNSLRSHEKVADVRILGAIGVVELTEEIDVEKVQKLLIEQGVWLRPYGKLLYTMPPFSISKQELLVVTKAIKKVLESL